MLPINELPITSVLFIDGYGVDRSYYADQLHGALIFIKFSKPQTRNQG